MTEENLMPPEQLAAAAQELSARVQQLGGQLEISETQVRKIKFLTIFSTVVAVIAILGMIGMSILFSQVHGQAQVNKATQVTNCQNANKSREAQVTLWTFLLSASQSKTPAEQDLKDSFLVWIQQLFAAHDCSDLSKAYPLPSPPVISKAG